MIDISALLKNDQTFVFVNKIIMIPPENFIYKGIECTFKFYNNAKGNEELGEKVANLFWEIALQEKPYGKHLIDIAVDKFVLTVNNGNRTQKMPFVEKCVKHITEHHCPLQAIKILLALVKQIPLNPISDILPK